MASQIMAVIGPDYALISAGRMDDQFMIYSQDSRTFSKALSADECRALAAAAQAPRYIDIGSRDEHDGPVRVYCRPMTGLAKLATALTSIAEQYDVLVALDGVVRVGVGAEYQVANHTKRQDTCHSRHHAGLRRCQCLGTVRR